MHRACGGRLGDGPRDRQPSGSRGRSARDQTPHARCRRDGPAHRGLPLQRSPAPDPLSRLRPGARQVPHQSRQRRHRPPPRRAVLDHLRRRPRQRQAGAHRRQRRLAQPGARAGEDAGEHRPRSRPVLRRDHQRMHGALRRAIDGAGDRVGPPERPDHHLVQDIPPARPDCRLSRSRTERPTNRCTSA